MVKVKPKHANSKIKFLSRKLKTRLNICILCWRLSTCFLFWDFSKVIGWWIKLWRLIKWLVENNSKNKLDMRSNAPVLQETEKRDVRHQLSSLKLLVNFMKNIRELIKNISKLLIWSNKGCLDYPAPGHRPSYAALIKVSSRFNLLLVKPQWLWSCAHYLPCWLIDVSCTCFKETTPLFNMHLKLFCGFCSVPSWQIHVQS